MARTELDEARDAVVAEVRSAADETIKSVQRVDGLDDEICPGDVLQAAVERIFHSADSAYGRMCTILTRQSS